MDNNQPNQWQPNQTPGQVATPNSNQNQWSPTPNNSTINQNQPTPPVYRPPVSYGDINSTPTPTNNQYTAPSFGSTTSTTAQPTSPQSVTPQPVLNQPNPNFGQMQTAGSVSQADQISSTQPTSADSQSPKLDVQKKPMGQNKVLFIVTAILAFVALGIMVVCFVMFFM